MSKKKNNEYDFEYEYNYVGKGAPEDNTDGLGKIVYFLSYLGMSIVVFILVYIIYIIISNSVSTIATTPISGIANATATATATAKATAKADSILNTDIFSNTINKLKSSFPLISNINPSKNVNSGTTPFIKLPEINFKLGFNQSGGSLKTDNIFKISLLLVFISILSLHL